MKTRLSNEELGKVTKCKDMVLETEANTNHPIIFPIAMHGCTRWTSTMADGKKNSFAKRC